MRSRPVTLSDLRQPFFNDPTKSPRCRPSGSSHASLGCRGKASTTSHDYRSEKPQLTRRTSAHSAAYLQARCGALTLFLKLKRRPFLFFLCKELASHLVAAVLAPPVSSSGFVVGGKLKSGSRYVKSLLLRNISRINHPKGWRPNRPFQILDIRPLNPHIVKRWRQK